MSRICFGGAACNVAGEHGTDTVALEGSGLGPDAPSEKQILEILQDALVSSRCCAINGNTRCPRVTGKTVGDSRCLYFACAAIRQPFTSTVQWEWEGKSATMRVVLFAGARAPQPVSTFGIRGYMHFCTALRQQRTIVPVALGQDKGLALLFQHRLFAGLALKYGLKPHKPAKNAYFFRLSGKIGRNWPAKST